MADGSVVLLVIAGLAVPVALLARCSATRRGLAQAWHRHEGRNARSGVFDRFRARAVYDPDWQWHWEACDRQRESLELAAMENLRTEMERESGEPGGAMPSTQKSARPSAPRHNAPGHGKTAPAGH